MLDPDGHSIYPKLDIGREWRINSRVRAIAEEEDDGRDIRTNVGKLYARVGRRRNRDVALRLSPLVRATVIRGSEVGIGKRSGPILLIHVNLIGGGRRRWGGVNRTAWVELNGERHFCRCIHGRKGAVACIRVEFQREEESEREVSGIARCDEPRIG